VAAHHELRRVVTNLCVLDFESPDHRMRLRSVHPGVSVEDVVAATGFELTMPADGVPASRAPTDDELTVLDALDPTGARRAEVAEVNG
jgi:acyl CoA:acetate/3-ketoacid CoA transferase beta subunit